MRCPPDQRAPRRCAAARGTRGGAARPGVEHQQRHHQQQLGLQLGVVQRAGACGPSRARSAPAPVASITMRDQPMTRDSKRVRRWRSRTIGTAGALRSNRRSVIKHRADGQAHGHQVAKDDQQLEQGGTPDDRLMLGAQCTGGGAAGALQVDSRPFSAIAERGCRSGVQGRRGATGDVRRLHLARRLTPLEVRLNAASVARGWMPHRPRPPCGTWPLRCQLVHHLRQHLRQLAQQIALRHAALLRQ